MIFSFFSVIVLFYSIILHEIAHGYAAYRNGDMTAYNAGRLTLNPIKHIDIFGSIIVPLISFRYLGLIFGWAKPVPYNPHNMKDNKYAELEVASAGILVNFFIVFISVLFFYIFRYFGILNQDIANILEMIAKINIFLALFNLLPFPPADGFSIFSELYLISQDFLLKFKNLFLKNKEYKVNYKDFNQLDKRNGIFKIKSLFTNPFVMFLIIFVAVNIFGYIVPYINQFLIFLFSF